MKTFIDTNFLVSLLVESEHTERAKRVFEKIADNDLITSVNVIEETLYILRRIFRDENEALVNILRNFIDGLELEVIDCLPLNGFFEVFEEYNLLPNDALIAATCKHYGIKKIATFDEDFERVDFLEVIEL